ncbi:hypothetical protein GH714_030361 [Hevea brasiliensis]|uniref:Squalene monooxygenase n=1 Tax=Hevea brasiliensis TaxID=3981 RepID=A0A6A6N5M1_HEVBR|nr:hypothetical protein GH714_030361 [Hevea brasiliensis]
MSPKVVGAYPAASPPPVPPVATVAPPIPLVATVALPVPPASAPPIAPTNAPPIPPEAPAIPFQLNTDLGAFVAQDTLRGIDPLLVTKDSGSGYGSMTPLNPQIGTAPVRGKPTAETRPSESKTTGATSSTQSKPITQLEKEIEGGKFRIKIYGKVDIEPVASTINTLASDLYKVFSASLDPSMQEMRESCFDYLTLDGRFLHGPIALLSGLKPHPLSLVLHFFVVAVYRVGRLLLPFPSPKCRILHLDENCM